MPSEPRSPASSPAGVLAARRDPVARRAPVLSRVRRRFARARGDQAGNTLVLFPAAVLIVLGLGAIAVDSATLFLGQRRLADLAAATANDAAAALAASSFYDGGAVAIDGGRATVRRDQLASLQSTDRAFESPSCTVSVAGTDATATCTAQVRPIFSAVWPGMGAVRTVRATETAVAVEGG